MTQPVWVDPSSSTWPERLGHLESPPKGVWQLGVIGPMEPSVAIVGSRRATFGGVEIAGWIAREVAAAGIQVISGMALGIDAAAHNGALEAGGSTVAVLGCGIDVCYPSPARGLAGADHRRRIADHRGTSWDATVQAELSEAQSDHRGARPRRRRGRGNRAERSAQHGPVGGRPGARGACCARVDPRSTEQRDQPADPGWRPAISGTRRPPGRRPGAPSGERGNRLWIPSRRGPVVASSVSAHHSGRYWHAWERNRSTRIRSGQRLASRPRWSPAGWERWSLPEP